MKTFKTIADYEFNKSILFAQPIVKGVFGELEALPDNIAVSVRYIPDVKSLYITVYVEKMPSDEDITELDKNYEIVTKNNTVLSFDDSLLNNNLIDAIKAEIALESDDLTKLKELVTKAVIVDSNIDGFMLYKIATLGLSVFVQNGKLNVTLRHSDGNDVDFDIYY